MSQVEVETRKPRERPSGFVIRKHNLYIHTDIKNAGHFHVQHKPRIR